MAITSKFNNSRRAPSIAELTTVVSAITTVWDDRLDKETQIQ